MMNSGKNFFDTIVNKDSVNVKVKFKVKIKVNKVNKVKIKIKIEVEVEVGDIFCHFSEEQVNLLILDARVRQALRVVFLLNHVRQKTVFINEKNQNNKMRINPNESFNLFPSNKFFPLSS